MTVAEVAPPGALENRERLAANDVEALFKDGAVNRIVTVFPHPDDQLYAAIVTHRLVQQYAGETDSDSPFLIDITLTHGEGAFDDELYDVDKDEIRRHRREENERGLLRLYDGYQDYIGSIQGFLPDGNLCENYSNVVDFLNNTGQIDSQTLVVTFDEIGGDGHQDHEVTSRAVRAVAKSVGAPVLMVGGKGKHHRGRFTASPIEQLAVLDMIHEHHSQLRSVAGLVGELSVANHYTLVMSKPELAQASNMANTET